MIDRSNLNMELWEVTQPGQGNKEGLSGAREDADTARTPGVQDVRGTIRMPHSCRV